jgi:hypothetical protein
MKTLKKVMLSLLVASSIGAVSTSALAESDPGRVTYKPAEAIDMTKGKIQLAIDSIKTGGSGDAVDTLIKDALNMSKEINANDRVDSNRSKANNKLKSAKTHAKENALQEAEQELRDAQKMFEDLKPLI